MTFVKSKALGFGIGFVLSHGKYVWPRNYVKANVDGLLESYGITSLVSRTGLGISSDSPSKVELVDRNHTASGEFGVLFRSIRGDKM